MGGWGRCDHGALSAAEANRVAIVEHQRNLSNCKSGQESCDYSQLTAAETEVLARAEHRRNYQACLTGTGYCDRSLLTPVERRSIPPDHASVPVADK